MVWWRGDQIPTSHIYPTVLIQGRVIPSNRLKLMGMCCWRGHIFMTALTIMGLHFQKSY